jgi:hypothetical protein
VPFVPLDANGIVLEGKLDHDKANLTWGSLPDFATNYSVLRSSNGLDFHQLGVIEHQATAGLMQYFDASPLHGNNFYKVIATDIDGMEWASNVVRLGLDFDTNFQIAQLSDEIVVSSNDGRIFEAQLLDLQGRKIAAANGGSSLKLPIGQAANGLAMLVIKDGTAQTVKKIVLAK